uniref:F-box domain-containing protein n=1 Tax=Spongospora subterranea TaxID=70186 RepID=A0A0H5R7Y7_9EUKA|eukprot:CRZ09931.1 hypothetical protein [Spongospora subterranea]
MTIKHLSSTLLALAQDVRCGIDVDALLCDMCQEVEQTMHRQELEETKAQLNHTQHALIQNKLEFSSEQERQRLAVEEQALILSTISQAESQLNKQLSYNSRIITASKPLLNDRVVLMRHIQFRSLHASRWAEIPAKFLTQILGFLDVEAAALASRVSILWRHALRNDSNFFRQIVIRRLAPPSNRKQPLSEDHVHRVAIRIYLNEDSPSHQIAFDQSLEQIRSEAQRVAREQETALCRLLEKQSDVARLDSKLSKLRRQIGTLNVVYGEQQDLINATCVRKKILVEQMAAADRHLAERRLEYQEQMVKCRERIHEERAEARRLDIVDREIERLVSVRDNLMRRLKVG